MAAAGFFVFAPVWAQGIPVIDQAAMSQSAMNFAKDLAEQVRQFEQMVAQLNQMKQQYDAMTKGRGLGNAFNDPKFQNYLPGNWKETYDKLRTGGAGALTGNAKKIYDAVKVYDTCKNFSAKMKTNCEARAVKSAMDQAFAMDIFEKAKDRVGQINMLIDQAAESKDQKEILEIQARIQGEQAMLQNESEKLRMYQMIAETEQKLLERQRDELAHEEVFGDHNFKPLEYQKVEW